MHVKDGSFAVDVSLLLGKLLWMLPVEIVNISAQSKSVAIVSSPDEQCVAMSYVYERV